jgi:hypothetical protein
MTKASIDLQDLRRRIYVKAKAEPSWRFWGLYVHVRKMDTLRAAYEMAKQNVGAPGVDGVTFEAIEAQGEEGLLEQLRDELTGHTYTPLPARRQEIPKAGGKVRILSIPAIRDRVVQGALKLILEPVFEADSNRDRLAIGPSGQHMTQSSESRRQLSNGRRAFSTLTCDPTSTMSGTTGCWKKWPSGLTTRTSCIF